MSNSLLWNISGGLYVLFHKISIHVACWRKHLPLTKVPINILKILFFKIHIDVRRLLKYLTHHLWWKLVGRSVYYLRGKVIIFVIMVHSNWFALLIEVYTRSDWQPWCLFCFIWRFYHACIAQALCFLDFSILSYCIDVITCKYVIVINCLLKLMF